MVVAGVLGGIVIVALAVGYVPLLITPPGPHVFGPYTLGLVTFNMSVNLTFPQCAIVAVNWSVVGAGNATLSVWGPSNPGGYSCSGKAPYENLTCPAQGCPMLNLNDVLVCVEAGTGGLCSFQSSGANYTFWNYVQFDTNLFTEVSFTATYS